jgi:hypothetical protein
LGVIFQYIGPFSYRTCLQCVAPWGINPTVFDKEKIFISKEERIGPSWWGLLILKTIILFFGNDKIILVSYSGYGYSGYSLLICLWFSPALVNFL